MADQTVTRTLIIRGSSPGVPETTAALKELAKTYDGVAVVSETASKRTVSMADVFNRLERSYVAGARQAQEYEKVVRQVNAAVSQNPALQERANAVLQQAAERLGQVGSALNRAREAQDQYNRSISNSSQNVNQRIGVKDDFGTQARGEDIAAYGAALTALQAKYDPLFAAGQRYKTALDGINQAERVGAITAQIAIDARLKETSSYNDQIQKLERLGAAKKAAAQTMVNQQTIVPDRGADIAAYGKQLDDLRAKYNPLWAAGQQYKAALTEINMAARTGAISEKERADAVMNTKVAFTQQVNTLRGVREATELAAASTEAHTNQSKLARHELINLSRQAQDVGVSIASGQSLLTVAFQQGSQIFDVFASSQASAGAAIKSLGTSIWQAITPARTFAAAGLAMGAAAVVSAFNWRDGQREITTALTGIGRESGATLGGINKFTVDAAANTRLYSGEARDLAVELLKTGQIGMEQFKGISEMAYGASRLLGVDLAEANKILAKSFAEPAEGIKTLGAVFGGVTASMRQHVEDLTQQGKIGEAQQFMAKIFGGTAKAAEQVGTLTMAWRGAMGAVDSFWNQFNKGLDRITGLNALEDKLVMLDRKLRSLNQQQQVESGQRVPGASIREGETGTEAKLRSATEERAGLNVQKQLAESGLGKEIGNILTSLGEINAQGVLSFTNIGNRLADMGKKLAPEVDQLRQMKATLEDLNNIDRPQVRAGMTPEQVKAVEQARDAYKATVGFIDQAQASSRGLTIQTAVAVSLMKDQVNVAAAMGGETRLQVQQQALVNQHLSQHKSLADANALAASQIGVIKAQEVAQTREALAAATDQIAVAQAVTGAEQIRAATLAQIAQAQRQYAGDAEAIANATAAAHAQEAAAFAQVNASVQQTIISLERQLSIIQAVGGAQRMAAQEAATYAELVDKGTNSSLAAAAAAAQRAVAQAQLNAGAREQLAALEDQYAVASATSGLAKIQAQGQATLNKLLRDGVGEMEAEAVASQQVANAREQINARIQEQTERLRDQTRLIESVATGTQSATAGAIAYRNAIDAGASSVVAIDHAIATAANSMAKLADEAARAQAAMERMESFSGWNTAWGGSGGGGTFDAEGLKHASGPVGGMARRLLFAKKAAEEKALLEKRITDEKAASESEMERLLSMPGPERLTRAISGVGSLQEAIDRTAQQPVFPTGASGGSTETEKFTFLSDLYGRLSREQGSTSQEQSFLEQTIAQLKTKPFELERSDLINNLSDKLEALTKATDSLADTMQISLDPIFSQGHAALRIGYYNEGGSRGSGVYNGTTPSAIEGLPAVPQIQPVPVTPATGPVGMPWNYLRAATGFDGIVGGSGGIDSTPVHMMLTPGERLQVTPASGPNPAWGRSLDELMKLASGPSPMPVRGPESPSARPIINDNRKTVTLHAPISIVNRGGGGGNSRLSAKQIQQGFSHAARDLERTG